MRRRLAARLRLLPVLAAVVLLCPVAAAHAFSVDELSLGAVPTGIAAGSDGLIYVLTDAPSLVVLRPDGTTVAAHPLPGGYGGASPVFYDGSLWWGATDALVRRDPDGTLARFPLSATPSWLTPAGDGNLWLLLGTTLARMTPDGLVTPLGAGPVTLTADATGQLWGNGPGISTFSVPASPPTRIATPSGDGAAVSLPANPWRVATSPSFGIAWFAARDYVCCYSGHTWFDYLYWLTPGTSGGRVGGGYISATELTDIAVGPDANAWVEDGSSAELGRVATSGRVTRFTTGLPAAATLGRLVSGPDGTMWYIDTGTGKLGRVALDQPTVATGDAAGVGQDDATVAGAGTPLGSASRIRFEYGPTAAYGAVTRWQDLGDGDAAVARSARLPELSPGTTYHYRAVLDSPLGTVGGADRTLQTTPLPPVPPPPPADVDGDGYAAAVDCDDHDASVYPGAPEVAGDKIDQDCDGADDPLPRFFPHVVTYFDNKAKRWSRFTSLEVDALPAGAQVSLACRGGGCRFRTWTLTVRHATAKLSLLRALDGSHLHRRAVLELRLTLAQHIGTVVRWTVGPPPKPVVTCLAPRAKKDTKC
jgi:hypothetical protein